MSNFSKNKKNNYDERSEILPKISYNFKRAFCVLQMIQYR